MPLIGRTTGNEPQNDLEEPFLLTDHADEEMAEEQHATLLADNGSDISLLRHAAAVQPANGNMPRNKHVPLQMTAMISNLSTSYNVVNISMVLPILQQILQEDKNSSTNTHDDHNKSLVATSLLAGMMVGQVVGGALGDSPYLGRLRALQCVMCLQVVASLASSMSGYHYYNDDDFRSGDFLWPAGLYVALFQNKTSSLYLQLAAWRFLLGIGAGAVYPLAAVISAEQANGDRSREAESISSSNTTHNVESGAISRVVLTFSMQGIGFLLVPVAAFILLHTFTDLNMIWRILLALGSLPGLILLILHCLSSCRREEPAVLAIPNQEDDPVTTQTPENEQDAVSELLLLPPHTTVTEPHGLIPAIQSEDNLLAKLMGTAVTWFVFDVLFYGNTLFQPIVMSAAFGKPKTDGISALRMLRQTAFDSLLLTVIALPGYFVAAWALGTNSWFRQTPRFVMLQGFACMSVLYLCIGLFWDRLKQSPAVLILLYGLTFFFANYGPNTTTFVLPSLIYSAPCRATLNGVSAAAGKFGAFVGAACFAPIADHYGDETVMLTCSILALLAFAITFQFVRI